MDVNAPAGAESGGMDAGSGGRAAVDPEAAVSAGPTAGAAVVIWWVVICCVVACWVVTGAVAVARCEATAGDAAGTKAANEGSAEGAAGAGAASTAVAGGCPGEGAAEAGPPSSAELAVVLSVVSWVVTPWLATA
jgi:hypothetical protein